LIKGRADIPAFLLQFVDLLSQHMKRSSASASDAQTFLHTIAEQFVSLIDFSCLTPVSPLPPHEGGYMQRKSHTMDKAAIVTSDSLVAFTRTVLSFGQDEDSLFHQTLARLLSQTKLLPISAFPGLWLPFLGSLASLLAAASVPLDEPCYRELYQTMLKTYLDRSVGPKPRKNASLVRPRVTCDYYSCGDCALLNSFLVDPRRDVGRFAVNKQRRAHLHQELDLAQIDCVHQTERVGSPQTLVVTKTFRQYETALHSWKQCSDAAKAQMQKFDQALLRQVLGDEFNDIVSLKYLLQTPVAPSTSNSVSASSSASASASSRVPLATIPQPERPSMGANTESKTMESSSGVVVGVKRKHELIDLTKD
jgi:hypothetical protein